MKVIDKKLMDELSVIAESSPRLRTHYNLHESLEEPIHRLVVATALGTYIRPHRHLGGDKFEFFVMLRGRGAILTFNEAGVIKNRHELEAGGKIAALELAPDEWHTFLPLEEKVLFCEVKPGPYIKPGKEDFATWAPEEGDSNTGKYVKWFRVAGEGEALFCATSEE